MTTVDPVAPGPVRLVLLRVAYLLVGGGLALVRWPVLLVSGTEFTLDEGALNAMLAALSLLSLAGLWRPLAMLPLLLFELLWKAIWLMHVAIPQLMAGSVREGTPETLFACAFAVPVLLFVPWDYVWRRYVRSAPPAA
ncbi:hypothetical protein B2G71_00835 [Novosphingobium sp. PC22D]|uniref:hypothetical protein n=1 Tax=Novosphingobium sp. PC22D TaxID=1962403 RepID=UPI000BFB0673|nr:hypothetical protein [Novosphingobium sp. PC22D]PEQ14188.1 hypothetical protein B2G71_00835 [Novosphingobium sp. PC22D]